MSARQRPGTGITGKSADFEHHGFQTLGEDTQIISKSAYLRTVFHPIECGYGQGCEQADDHDDNHDFDEGEGTPLVSAHAPYLKGDGEVLRPPNGQISLSVRKKTPLKLFEHSEMLDSPKFWSGRNDFVTVFFIEQNRVSPPI